MLAENEFFNNPSDSYIDISEGSDGNAQDDYFKMGSRSIDNEKPKGIYLNDNINDGNTFEVDLSFIGENIDKKQISKNISDETRAPTKMSSSFLVPESTKKHNTNDSNNKNILFLRKKLFDCLKEEAEKESYRLNRSKFKEKCIPPDKNKLDILKNLKKKLKRGRERTTKRKSIVKRPVKERFIKVSPEKEKMVRSTSIEKISSTDTIDILQIESFADFSDSMFPYKVKNKIKVFQCPQPGCSQELPSLSRIKRHYLVHTNLKPFKCLNTDCNKRFSRKDNMLQHFRTHCDGKKKKKKKSSR